MKRVALAGVGLALITSLAIPAMARHTDQPDPNDTDGRLDLREVRLDHYPGPPRWTAISFQRWSIEQLWDRGYVIVELDTRGDEAVDHLLVAGSDGEVIVAHLYRVRRDGTQVELGTIDAGKEGSRSLAISVALHKLSIGSNRTAYYWAVLSSFVGSACPQTCLDRVPDQGMVEQLLPGVTPTPTPTPTPSPQP
jgi:hypothetical protein